MDPAVDTDSVQSFMWAAAWKMCDRLDPYCPQSWPTALAIRIHGATIEALRDQDPRCLTLQQRVDRYQHDLEQLTHELGRCPTRAEKAALAHKVAPRTTHTDWPALVLLDPREVLGDIDWADVDTLPSELPAEDIALDHITTQAINSWMSSLPHNLRKILQQNLAQGTPIDPKTYDKIAPYVCKLSAVLNQTDVVNNSPIGPM